MTTRSTDQREGKPCSGTLSPKKSSTIGFVSIARSDLYPVRLGARVFLCLLALVAVTQPGACYARGLASAPRAMILTAFPPELRPWLHILKPEHVLKIRGAYAPVWCDVQHVCVTETGEGEINAALSVNALVESGKFNLKDCVFIRVGIAGGPPRNNETLGSVVWANWVVSWAFGHHLPPTSAGRAEPDYLPQAHRDPPISTLAFRINPEILRLAVDSDAGLNLTDSVAARRESREYPSARGKRPTVTLGVDVSGTDFWVGRTNSAVAQQIASHYTHGVGRYAVTAMEGLGDESALSRWGLVEHYVSVRGVSDFDQPPTGESPVAMVLRRSYPGGAVAISNVVRAAHRFIKWIIRHPNAVVAAFRCGQCRQKVSHPWPFGPALAEGYKAISTPP